MALPEYTTTEDGIEMQMGVNHFGNVYLLYVFMVHLAQLYMQVIIMLLSTLLWA